MTRTGQTQVTSSINCMTASIRLFLHEMSSKRSRLGSGFSDTYHIFIACYLVRIAQITKKFSCEQICNFFDAGKSVEQIAKIKRTEGSNLGLVCIAGTSLPYLTIETAKERIGQEVI